MPRSVTQAYPPNHPLVLRAIAARLGIDPDRVVALAREEDLRRDTTRARATASARHYRVDLFQLYRGLLLDGPTGDREGDGVRVYRCDDVPERMFAEGARARRTLIPVDRLALWAYRTRDLPASLRQELRVTYAATVMEEAECYRAHIERARGRLRLIYGGIAAARHQADQVEVAYLESLRRFVEVGGGSMHAADRAIQRLPSAAAIRRAVAYYAEVWEAAEASVTEETPGHAVAR